MEDFGTMLSRATCVDAFLQPTWSVFGSDTFVINFSKGGTFLSFHSFSMVRLVHNGKVAYTTTDHYLNDRGFAWRRGQKKMSTATFRKFKDTLIGERIVSFTREQCGDVRMEFGNSAVLEFLVDASRTPETAEAHRLLVEKNDGRSECEHYIFER